MYNNNNNRDERNAVTILSFKTEDGLEITVSGKSYDEIIDTIVTVHGIETLFPMLKKYGHFIPQKQILRIRELIRKKEEEQIEKEHIKNLKLNRDEEIYHKLSIEMDKITAIREENMQRPPINDDEKDER